MRINIPNQITLGRLGLAIVFVALLSCFDATRIEQQRWLLQVCFWIFLAAVVGDVLDGLLARLLHSVTSFGRIADPVVDKVLVCGAFVLFASPHFWDGERNIAGVQAWMAIVILTRELLVSAVRSHVEAEGQEFGASWVGKLKMFVQSATVCVVLGRLAWQLEGLATLHVVAIWATIVITVASAVSYVRRARAFLLTSAALAGEAADSASEEPPTTRPSPPEEHTP